jgi:cbb3-type cytochrome oxidase subunit 3
MDLNLIRSLVMLAAFGAFLGVVLWAYWPSRKAALERHARLAEDE